MKNVLSCVQPTGDLHLGNYFGAVQNWVRLQDQYECRYGVVDYHSMTMPYNPAQLRENTWRMVFYLLACGIKPEHLFIQSLVPEHAELAWILSCTSSYGELTRMTQFKDKTEQLREADKEAFVSVGLFAYPVLQAADILIYHADYVPVGKDQEQHLELSRNIAQRFNHQFGREYFVHPEPLFTETPKILSPADPTKKMSKSLGNHIPLLSEPWDMFGKVMSVKDELLEEYFILCTDVSEDFVSDMKQKIAAGANPRDFKLKLASEIVLIYHGKEKALKAQESFINTFKKGAVPEDIETIVVSEKKTLADVLLEAHIVASKSEWRRLVGEGAISYLPSNKKVLDPNALAEDGDLKVGKRRFIRIKIII